MPRRKNAVIIISILFLLSFTINIYMGLSNYLKSTYTPNEQDLEILGEMTKMVNDSE